MVESKHQWKAWLYLSPALVLLLVFTVWPIFNTVAMAFQNNYTAGLGAAQGIKVTYTIGVQNFVNVVRYDSFGQALWNTMLLCVATVPLSTALALLIAVALNSIGPLKKFLQTIFFLPYVTNSIAIGMVFAAMFNVIGLREVSGQTVADTWGIINNAIEYTGFYHVVAWFNDLLRLIGLEPILELVDGKHINWINQGSGYWANMIVMIVYIVWNALPFKILVLLGGLQSINKQYYEAARVDGTPRHRVLTKITVPLLSPMIAYVVITGFIGGFKEYSSIVGIFGDTMGPPTEPGRLNTMVGLIYDSLNAGSIGSQGKASAAALILFGIILVVTLINLQVSKKRVHY